MNENLDKTALPGKVIPVKSLILGGMIIITLAVLGGGAQYFSAKEVIGLASEKQAWELNRSERINALDSLVEEKTKQIDALASRMSQDQEQQKISLKKYRGELQAKEESIALLNERVKALQKQLGLEKAKMETALSELLKASNQFKTKKNDLDESQNKLAVNESVLESIKVKIDEEEKKLDSVKQATIAAEGNVSAAEKKYLSVSKKLASVSAELKMLDDKQQRLSELSAKEELLAKSAVILEEQKNTIESVVNKLSKEKSSLLDDTRKLENKKLKVAKEIDDKQAKVSELLAENKSLKRENEEIKVGQKSVDLNLSALKAMTAAEFELIKKLQPQKASLEKTVEALEDARLKEQKKMIEASAELKTIELKIAEHKKTSSDLNELKGTLTEYEKQAMARKKDLRITETKLEEMKKKLESAVALYAKRSLALENLENEIKEIEPADDVPGMDPVEKEIMIADPNEPSRSELKE